MNLCLPAALAAGATLLSAQPVELGGVRWSRDLDAALARSGQSGKPALVLFQEVPG